VRPDGAAEEVRLPQAPVQANQSLVRLEGVLDTTGRFTGHYGVTALGSEQYALRSAFEHPFDSTRIANFGKKFARDVFPESAADSIVIFDGKDLAHAARVALRIVDGRATTSSGDTEILNLPFPPMGRFAELATAIEEDLPRHPRRLPIDVAKVTGSGIDESVLRVTLPAGWHARLPKNVQAQGDFGSFSVTYAQQGRELVMTRRAEGNRSVLGPERVGDLVAWLRTVGQDDAKFLVLEKH